MFLGLIMIKLTIIGVITLLSSTSYAKCMDRGFPVDVCNEIRSFNMPRGAHSSLSGCPLQLKDPKDILLIDNPDEYMNIIQTEVMERTLIENREMLKKPINLIRDMKYHTTKEMWLHEQNN